VELLKGFMTRAKITEQSQLPSRPENKNLLVEAFI
jgi:hypothetical protein